LYNQSNTRFGVTPKLGLAFALGNVGLFAEGNYHLIFSNDGGSASTGSMSNVNFENPNKFYALNVGVTFGFPRD